MANSQNEPEWPHATAQSRKERGAGQFEANRAVGTAQGTDAQLQNEPESGADAGFTKRTQSRTAKRKSEAIFPTMPDLQNEPKAGGEGFGGDRDGFSHAHRSTRIGRGVSRLSPSR